MENIFEYNDYKDYLRTSLGGEKKRTGLRAKAATAMGCQTAYLSQVLNGSAHISLEQGEKLNHHLGHSKEASHYFYLLIQRGRAGTPQLQAYFDEHIREIQSKRLDIKSRVVVNQEILPADQNKYYSRWYYLAIHVALSVPQLRTVAALVRHLALPKELVQEVLSFLVYTGLAKETKGVYSIGSGHIHLGRDSENILKHHSNWRIKALESLDLEKESELHYSVVYSLAKKDALKIKDRIIEVVQENLKTVGPSQEEVLYCNTIDFFEI